MLGRVLGIKELPEPERPRERCLSRGPGALSTTELPAILLRTGNRGTSAVEMAGHSWRGAAPSGA